MRFISASFFSFAFVLVSLSQSASPTPLLFTEKTINELKALQKAALADDFALNQIRFLTDNIGARLSGSAQAARAVEYVAAEMRSLGFEVRLQEMKVPHWVRGIETGEIVESPGMAPRTTRKIFLTALGGSIATPADGITAEIVAVRTFDELAQLGPENVKGKIVLFNNKFDAQLAAAGFGLAAYARAVQYRSGGAVAASRMGAVAALVRSAGNSQNRLPHTGAMGYADDVPKIPVAAVAYEDAEILSNLASQGKVRVRITLTPQTLPDALSHNVIADLKGSERPEEIVLVGGHLDSWDLGTGALDNASGVAVSMQVLYLVRKLNLKPKRTLRFVAFMNEENGSRGSQAYFDEYKNALDKHFATIESDLGASHPIGFNFAGKAAAASYFGPITAILQSHDSAQFQLAAGGVGADTGILTRSGVPGFSPWFDQRTYFNYHHNAADTFDKIVPKELAELGSLMVVLAYGIANLEQPLPR